MQRLAIITSWLLLVTLSSSSAKAEIVERAFKVTFVSADLVYLNAGRADGLVVGAKSTVVRDGQTVAELEVLHLAEHSSACRFVSPATTVRVGDVVKASIDLKAAADSSNSPQSASSQPAKNDPIPDGHDPSAQHDAAQRPGASGSISLLYSNWDDHNDSDLDFAQGRVDFDLRVEPLWTSGLSFALRTSGRQDRRSTSITGSGAETWENRIATFALEYKPDGSRMGMSMGRINPARVGAIGRLDGGSFEYRLSEPVRVGVFAGANSQWQYAENRPDLQTYGVYAGYRRGSARDLLLDQTFSVVGQYHGRVASREALFAQGRITQNGRWNISHSVEVDVNRGWRKGEGDPAFELSTVYAQGRVNLNRSVAASLSYDTRKSFRTYETRDIADSIFDDRVRQGVRTQFDVTLFEGTVLTAGAGVRSVADESDRTISYNGAVRKQGVFNQQSTLNVQGAAFESKATSGYNFNASLGQGLRQRDWISLGAGLYSYTLSGGESRMNRKVDLTARISVTRALAVNALGQLSGGDDTRGHRLEAGFSVQF